MSTIPERLEKLRAKMQEKGIDIYIIPTADFHQSEYVGEHFKARKFITGFSGSAGTAVITKTEARLWTDGRYFIQAAAQLEGTTVELMKMGEPGVPEMNAYIEEVLQAGETLGFDGRVVSVGEGEGYAAIAAKKNAKVNYQVDLIDEIWEDRPALSEEPAFDLDVKYAGETVESKLARIREEMKESGANKMSMYKELTTNDKDGEDNGNKAIDVYSWESVKKGKEYHNSYAVKENDKASTIEDSKSYKAKKASQDVNKK